MSGKARNTPVEAHARADKKIDKAVDMSFSASDPTSHGMPTSTEVPSRPQDREAPRITKERRAGPEGGAQAPARELTHGHRQQTR
jgi:hypothetical protein